MGNFVEIFMVFFVRNDAASLTLNDNSRLVAIYSDEETAIRFSKEYAEEKRETHGMSHYVVCSRWIRNEKNEKAAFEERVPVYDSRLTEDRSEE